MAVRNFQLGTGHDGTGAEWAGEQVDKLWGTQPGEKGRRRGHIVLEIGAVPAAPWSAWGLTAHPRDHHHAPGPRTGRTDVGGTGCASRPASARVPSIRSWSGWKPRGTCTGWETPRPANRPPRRFYELTATGRQVAAQAPVTRRQTGFLCDLCAWPCAATWLMAVVSACDLPRYGGPCLR